MSCELHYFQYDTKKTQIGRRRGTISTGSDWTILVRGTMEYHHLTTPAETQDGYVEATGIEVSTFNNSKLRIISVYLLPYPTFMESDFETFRQRKQS